MYEETLVVFLSDNGAPANLRQSSHNYPHKGGKYADWEDRKSEDAHCFFFGFLEDLLFVSESKDQVCV